MFSNNPIVLRTSPRAICHVAHRTDISESDDPGVMTKRYFGNRRAGFTQSILIAEILLIRHQITNCQGTEASFLELISHLQQQFDRTRLKSLNVPDFSRPKAHVQVHRTNRYTRRSRRDRKSDRRDERTLDTRDTNGNYGS